MWELRMNLNIDNLEKIPSRDGYGKGLVKLGMKNKNVVVLCCDLTDSTRVDWFKKKYPERFIEVGVAEQNMAGLAAGLAMTGKIPFISSYAT
jgi:transketolase